MASILRSLSLVSAVALLSANACLLTLDFDELEGDSPVDAGGSGGEGSGGEATGGGSGGSAGTGGAADTGGSGGEAGEVGSGGAGTGGAGTGGGGGGSGGAPMNIPLADAPERLADALCTKLEECFSLPAVEWIFGDEECRVTSESLLANTMVAGIEVSEGEGTVTYDGTELPECLEALLALDCTEFTIEFPEACKETLSGLVGEGETCNHSLECESGLYCDISSCPGTCREPLAEGETCGPTDTCERGHTCFNDECVALGDEGDPCGGADLPEDCLGGLLCVGVDDNAGTPGECYPATNLFVLSESQQCSLGNPPALCRSGISCTLFTGTCTAEADSLGACEAALPDMCPEGEYCPGLGGNCTPKASAGESCNVLVPCEGYLRCINGTCRPLSDNGEPCVANEECFSGYCPDTECAPPICQ